MILRPTIVDCYILIFDVAELLSSCPRKRCDRTSPTLVRSAVKEANRSCRLLGARRERPCHRRTAEQRDQLAPCHEDHGLPSGTRCTSLQHLSLPPKYPQVLGADLNCSESGEALPGPTQNDKHTIRSGRSLLRRGIAIWPMTAQGSKPVKLRLSKCCPLCPQ